MIKFIFPFLLLLFCVMISTAKNNAGTDFLKETGSESELYVGTFTPNTGSGEGIYQFDQDALTRNWRLRNVTTAGSPSFLIANRNRSRLYAVNELYNQEGEIGTVSAYEIDSSDGQLVFVNSQSSVGNGPTHLALDPTEKMVLVANFGTGNVVVFPLLFNGALGPISDNVLPSSDDGRSPGAHMVIVDPNNSSRVAAVYYGLDQVLFYTLHTSMGKLSPVNAQLADGTTVHLRASVRPGSGARHMVYAKDGAYFYVISETRNTISVFDYNFVCNGSYFLIQTVSTLPVAYPNVSYAGGISLHPNGRFLYASNRGHDSIAVFSVDVGSGVLTPIQYMPCGGAYPRHFAMDHSGRSIVVGNQNSGNVVEFSIDKNLGYLLAQTQEMQVPTPTCPLLV